MGHPAEIRQAEAQFTATYTKSEGATAGTGSPAPTVSWKFILYDQSQPAPPKGGYPLVQPY